MRLLYVHNIAMPGPEANTVNVAKMCSAFAANGCDVTLAALRGAPAPTMCSAVHRHYGLKHAFTVQPLSAACARPVIAAVTAVAMARRGAHDLVYTRTPHVALAACLAGMTTVLEVHTSDEAFGSAGRAAFRAALRHPRLAGVVAISGALAQHLHNRAKARRVIVAHDGADAHLAETAPTSNERFSVGFVGRFYRGKGLELIAALAPLCPWADFHLVGGSADAAPALLSATLPTNIICHGAIPHADVARKIAAWDVVIAPYQRTVLVADGKTDAARWMSPLKIFEYMAVGKAILASDLPVLREILTESETARLLPPDNPRAWAAALENLRDNPESARRLGESARTTFLAKYTWEARARHICDMLTATAQLQHVRPTQRAEGRQVS